MKSETSRVERRIDVLCMSPIRRGVWFFYLIKIFLLVNFSGAWKCLLICIIGNAFHFKVVVNFLVLL